jgi:DNA-binding response OmpR family regulator
VIVLTGRGADDERVRGLEFGADDYLVKPFHYPELRARINAILRRRGGHQDGPRRVGDLVVDPARRRVWVEGRDVRLSNKEFSLLRVLVSDPIRVFPKKELLEEVWGFRTSAQTRTLDSHASRLRRKLDPEHSRYVINCWGVGYRLIDG